MWRQRHGSRLRYRGCCQGALGHAGNAITVSGAAPLSLLRTLPSRPCASEPPAPLGMALAAKGAATTVPVCCASKTTPTARRSSYCTAVQAESDPVSRSGGRSRRSKERQAEHVIRE